MMLSAHVTGLIGACLLIGFAVSVPHLAHAPARTVLVARLLIVSNYANLIIGTGKAFLFVHGISAGGGTANTVVFALLTLFVVVPGLVSTFLWAVGFSKQA